VDATVIGAFESGGGQDYVRAGAYIWNVVDRVSASTRNNQTLEYVDTVSPVILEDRDLFKR
jgi:hypothetical protein